MKANNDVREAAKKAGVKHWEIAARLGVSEQTFVRWMRSPLVSEKEDAILNAVNELAKEKEAC